VSKGHDSVAIHFYESPTAIRVSGITLSWRATPN